ncbi:MAG TPA: hypothetical protein VMM76_23915 [Pirellulaceae bacterium]|nr:hypothetical protein [Pirellulaceae bacterium]
MKDLISTMFRLPMAMAQMGADQLQQVLERDGSGRGPQDPELRPNGDRNPAGELFATMIDAGGRLMRGMTDGAWETPPDVDLDRDGNDDADFFSAQHPSASPGYQRRGAEVPTATAPRTSSGSRSQPRVYPSDFGRLDVSTMVIVGEGLAAGLGNFALSSDSQRMSFPAQLARHFGTECRQPLFEAPGVSFGVGPEHNFVRLPDLGQATVFEDYPRAEFGNLSIPGFRVRDCLRLHPMCPSVHPQDPKQTLANLILDPHRSIDDTKVRPHTQLECAIGRHPTFVVVALGFAEVMEAAVSRQVERLPSLEDMRRDFESIVKAFCAAQCGVLVLNVPNPIDTAAFSSLESAGRVLKVSPSALARLYQLNRGDRITVAGLLEIGTQINRRQFAPLDRRHVLAADVAERIASYTGKLNEVILQVVDLPDRVGHCDIAALFRDLSSHGQRIGAKHFTADYLGGVFGLNGYSLGHTGQALVANCVIRTINESFGAAVPDLPLPEIAANDPIASYRAAAGRNWTDDEFESMPRASAQAAKELHPEASCKRVLFGKELDESYNAVYRDPPQRPLQLPPGLEQVLPLNKHASYHSDAMRVVNCLRAEQVQWGACSDNVFDGLAIFGSQLAGSLRFRFSPPVDNVSHFEVSIDGALIGDEGVLATPDFLRFPLLRPRVVQPPRTICSGDVNLITGEIANLDFMFVFENSGLSVLQRLNPRSFPRSPIIRYKQGVKPHEGYGTAWARFQQRDDGKLDFLFHGTAFVPMGPGFRFALPMGNPDGDFATLPANGTQLHPHLHLSTVESRKERAPASEPWIPTNTVCEFTADASRTSFGDDFTLNHPDLGFAQGRSHLAGRMRIQFGTRFGDLVPFSVRMLPPAGMLDSANLSPLQDVFPGRLVPGMVGHDAVLRFRARQYRQTDLYLLDDPFDIPVGAVNVYTGEVIGDFLHRGLLGQALFFALVRVEPRTPQGSFEYRGAARFERGPNGQLRFRFNGTVFLPYQEGFLWPLPDLANGIPIGPNSRLDPFFQVEAVHEPNPHSARKSGGGRMQLAPTGDRFSYRFSVSSDPREQSDFEYTNHSQEATFQMHRVASVTFVRSKCGTGDVVTFSGFGAWSKDKSSRLRLASVQVSTERDRPYVSILIDGGRVSSVNTKLQSEMAPLTDLSSQRSLGLSRVYPSE